MSQESTRIITPNQRFSCGAVRSLRMMIRNLAANRELILLLFKRDFLASYRRSFIGPLWILLSPLTGVISWVLLNATQILRPGDPGVPYPAYVLIGTTVWGLFVSIVTALSFTLQASREMVVHAKFPHEAIYAAQTLVHLAGFGVALGVSITACAVFGIFPAWQAILLPVVALPLIIFAVSVGLVNSVISAISYDLAALVNGAMGLVMFVTPVIYAPSAIADHRLRAVVELNPLTHCVAACRDLILLGRIPLTPAFLLASLASVALFVVCWRIFFLTEERMIERLM